MADFEQMADWDNQPQILPFITVNFKEGTRHQKLDAYDMFKHGLKKAHFWIVVDGRKIGYVTYDVNPPHLLISSEESVWISICIGEKDSWGRGYAKEAMALLENEVKKAGYKRIELGVFSYNSRARSLYEKMNYQEFATIKKFTYYLDRWHDDIRMQKYV
nr:MULTISPECIES: GNAT family protein [unclassified Fusibacter]